MRCVFVSLAAVVFTALLQAAPSDHLDPRADPYFANPELRALMDWVTFRLTFDGDSLTPDMAAGAATFTLHGRPRFAPGVKGRALLAGDGSGSGMYPRAGNAPLASRGAISVWICPVAWTRGNGGNTVVLMTTNSSFYLQRQGPLHNAEGVCTRNEGLQFLMLSDVTGNNCLMFGTEGFPQGKWRLLVANWSWPVMQFSLDGGEFQSLTVKQSPTEAEFGGLIVGAADGEPTLIDELTIYRRPLSLQEARSIYSAIGPKESAR